MVDNYNELVAGKKRKNDGDDDSSSKKACLTLKEKVETLIQVQENLLDLLKNKLGISDEEIEQCKNVTSVTHIPMKRTTRNNPGIYIDEKNRKYYINQFGVNVYKRPCGKPRKDMEWCYSSGDWVTPGYAYKEDETLILEPNDKECNKEESDSDEEDSESGDVSTSFGDVEDNLEVQGDVGENLEVQGDVGENLEVQGDVEKIEVARDDVDENLEVQGDVENLDVQGDDVDEIEVARDDVEENLELQGDAEKIDETLKDVVDDDSDSESEDL
jgi:hypothetical protein